MALKHFSRLLAAVCLPLLMAQTNILTVEQPEKVTVKRGATAHSKLKLALQPGFHVNSNKPSDDYLIPLKLTWLPGALETVEVAFPKAGMEKYEFSEKPLSVYTGTVELTTTFKTAAGAAVGPGVLLGKLRYQACNNKACFPPKTVDVKLPFSVQ